MMTSPSTTTTESTMPTLTSTTSTTPESTASSSTIAAIKTRRRVTGTVNFG